MEGRGLNAETLEKLTKICPTQEETTKILQFTGDPAKLADAEAFLHHILRAIPSAFVRFNAMLFRESYEPEILHLKEKSILHFNLTSLRRLSDVKSADDKTMLLHFVVEQVAKSEGKQKSEEIEMEERERLMLGLPVMEAVGWLNCIEGGGGWLHIIEGGSV
ncbi:hypothetical protein SASPL_155302 [Salvia splendens]|uniref:FH2 domain-containing protein n=1 Tax=Salvia splendens TaxID=180675 RepID=A0A8X8W1S5_SALSN|nr:hypothetical protein SASPL_155302 [Salvia splendens]